MEGNIEPKLNISFANNALPIPEQSNDASYTRDTLQKNKDSVIGTTRVAPTGSLFMAATKKTVVGDGSTVSYPILGEKTGIVYMITDLGGTTVPGNAVIKIAKAQPGYYFYLTYDDSLSGNYLDITPSITGTTINDSSSVYAQYVGATIFVGTSNGWYTMTS